MSSLIWTIVILVLVVPATAFFGYLVGSSRRTKTEPLFGRSVQREDGIWLAAYFWFCADRGLVPIVDSFFGPFDDGTVRIVNKGNGTLGSAGIFEIKMQKKEDRSFGAVHLTYFTLEPRRMVEHYNVHGFGRIFTKERELKDPAKDHWDLAAH